MRMKHLVLLVALLTALALAAAFAFPRASAGRQTSDQDKKMMEQMMKYGTPGKNHELLKNYVGDWDVEIKMWPNPAAEPMISKGTYKNQLIFDGRYLKGQFEGLMGGMKSMGLEVIGFDLFKNKYTTFWIDSWSTSFVWTSGTLDASGKVLSETGMFPDPLTDGRETQKVRNVTTFIGDGQYRFEMFMSLPDGREMKGLELLCTRIR